MKALDKIYVHITPHLGLLEATAIPVDAPGEQVYIRKDALISFLEKEKYDLFNWHFQDEDRKFKVYEEVIDKIKEL